MKPDDLPDDFVERYDVKYTGGDNNDMRMDVNGTVFFFDEDTEFTEDEHTIEFKSERYTFMVWKKVDSAIFLG